MRFGFGFAGFLLVLILIEKYDEETGSHWFYLYTIIVLLGYALANRGALAGQLASIEAGIGASKTGGK